MYFILNSFIPVKTSEKCIKGLKLCPTYVDDIANCILLGLKMEISGIYHVANSECVSRFELTKRLFERLDSTIPIHEFSIENFDFKEEKALDTTLNSNKFNEIINFSFTPIEKVISKFVTNLEIGC